jgi:hypothetical protein
MPRCLTSEGAKRGTVEIMRIGTTLERFTIDGIAATVWKRMNGKTQMSAVITEVTKKYAVTPLRARRDIKKLVSDLLSLKLIREEATVQSLASKDPYSSKTKRSQSRQKNSISGKAPKKSVERRKSCSLKKR